MANVISTQILEDGERNATVKITGVLDTSNASATTIVDPASYSPVPTQFRIDQIDYAMSGALQVRLFWDATTDVDILPIAGRGTMNFKSFGGLLNNAGSGKTGKIQLSTNGWTSGTEVFSIVLRLVKQDPQ
jgi:hypothetical protein